MINTQSKHLFCIVCIATLFIFLPQVTYAAEPADLITGVEAVSRHDAGDVISITFSEPMNQSTVCKLSNWQIGYSTDPSGGPAIPINVADAVYFYDDSDHILTITLNEKINQSYVPDGKYIIVKPANDCVLNALGDKYAADISKSTDSPVVGETTGPMVEAGWTKTSPTEFVIKYDEVLNKRPFVLIAGGRNHSIGLKNNGIVWAWGNNWKGQLG